jgi:hypothetical protein
MVELALADLISLTALVIVAVLLFLLLFEPAVAYRVRPPAAPDPRQDRSRSSGLFSCWPA